jgi:transposase, IS605 orfB family
MILSKKIMLLPTPEQVIALKKSAGTARWSYNYMLSRNNESDTFINERDIRKEITLLKKTDEYSWLKEVSANIPKQACKDCQNAYNRMFKGEAGKPNFKKRGFKDSFYVNYETFHKTQNGCHIEKIGSIKTVEQIPTLDKYINPRVVFDNKYWHITFSYEVEEHKEDLSKNRPLGIDLGIKTFVTTSDNQFF